MAGITAEIKLSGFEQFDHALQLLQEQGVHLLAGGLYKEGEEAMTDAKDHFVPVFLGTLKNSGFVDLPVQEGEQLIVRLHFGGAAGAYADVIHEGRTPGAAMPPAGALLDWMAYKGIDPKLEFVVRRSIGQKGIKGTKYLETPLMNRVDGMAQRLASYMEGRIAALLGL